MDGKKVKVTVPADKASYPRMLSALQALGISASNYDHHENHFHLEFRTPTILDIDQKKNLLADGVAGPGTSDATTASAGLEDAVAWARSDLNFEPGEATMVTMDLPNASPATQVVLIAQAPQASNSAKDKRVVGVCRPINYHFPTEPDGSYWPDFEGGIGPESVAQEYFWRYEKRTDVSLPPLSAVEVLVPPEHGVVKLGTNGGGDPQYNYIPNVNYLGKDKIVFLVTTSAGTVVVQYYLVVTNKGADSKPAERFCNQPARIWKISLPTTSPSLDNAALQALLDATGINNRVTVTTADLSGGAVGQATGSSITLDTNAAGYGWYIDYTPYLNDEYLPTSNPNEWIAKEQELKGPGSDCRLEVASFRQVAYRHG